MKKIIFVSTMISVPWGGSEELWSGAALQLKNSGFEVYINVKEWGEIPEQLTNLEKAGCKVERRRFFIQATLSRRVLDKLLPGTKRSNTSYDTKEYLSGISPDLVVICQGSNQDGIEWMEMCLSLKMSFASITQSAAEQFWPQDSLSFRMKECFATSLMNFFVSEKNLTLTEKQIGEKIQKGRVVRNPFNVPYHINLPWPKGEKIKLACVGRIQPDAKGQDILFETLAQDKWKQRNIELTLFGNGPNRESLEKLLNFYSLENIKFGEFSKNVLDIWANHHALALPSRYEGLPLAVVEAMLAGRVCIVTDVAGNKEVLENNVTGFLAAAPTAELYDLCLENAWEKRDSWFEIGQRAQIAIKTLVPENPALAFSEQIKMLL